MQFSLQDVLPKEIGKKMEHLDIHSRDYNVT
jgi:hypothetical protein